MLAFEFAKAYFEGGLCLISSGEDYVLTGTQIRVKTPSELLAKTGARMMAITLPDPNFGAFLTIPASGGRFMEIFRSEMLNNLTPGDDRALGSCLHRFQSLVELNAAFTSDYNSRPIADAERVVTTGERLFYEFEALVRDVVKGFTQLRYKIWGRDTGCPRSFENVLQKLDSVTPELRAAEMTLKSAKNFRDCIEHNTDIGSGSWVQHTRVDAGLWKTFIRIPDNPESKSRRKFTFTMNRDGLSEAWKLVTEYFYAMAYVYGRTDLRFGA
jgi:hypothetical protein